MSDVVSNEKSPKDKEGPPETKGWLYKWTNYIKGYQKRWFVLSNGLLSYYRNQAEMAHTCRGTISLHGAIIHTEDSCNFIVSNGGGTQSFHLRASTEVERQRWVTALELAKAKAIQMLESEDDDIEEDAPGEIDKQELLNVVKALASKLEDLQTCHELIVKHGHALQRSLTDLEIMHNKDSGSNIPAKVKTVNERATLFKITSNAMINASSEFLDLCQNNGKKWQRLLSSEREIRQRLEDMVEQLAKQHSHLEAMVRKEISEHHNDQQNGVPVKQQAPQQQPIPETDHPDLAKSITSSDGDDDFSDALSEPQVDFMVPAPPGHRRSSSQVSAGSALSEGKKSKDEDEYLSGSENDDIDHTSMITVYRTATTEGDESSLKSVKRGDGPSAPSTPPKRSVRKRRSTVPERPNIGISLWSIMKNCIGKDLTKIPIPVNFSEPLSMLQRLTEDYEYAEILDKAALCSDNCEQMAYVAAFTLSSYSTTAIRTGKPFNPLLGETYECDRSDDKGWRCINEQVSHHPPMVSQYCESTSGTWKCWQEFTMRSKFKGKYLEVEPLGIAHLEFPRSGNHYTWRKVKTVVHNIVIGKLWIDQHGEMEIINHKTGDKCFMKFEAYSYFGGTPKKVTGTVINSQGKVEWVLNGTWDTQLEGSKVIGEKKVKGKSSLEIDRSKLLWKGHPIDPESEKIYNFSKFACELNEPEAGVAPTDCRLRPDQRLMEEGNWDEANTEKVRLEEKQRTVRKERELAAEIAAQEGKPYEGHQPRWFKKVKDEQNGDKYIYGYSGGYWEAKKEQKWENCPDIF